MTLAGQTGSLTPRVHAAHLHGGSTGATPVEIDATGATGSAAGDVGEVGTGSIAFGQITGSNIFHGLPGILPQGSFNLTLHLQPRIPLTLEGPVLSR